MLIHTFHPQQIIITFGPVSIHWYGVLVVSGVLLGLAVVLKLAKFYKVAQDDVYDAVFYLAIFGLLGARLYEILLFPKYYWQNPLEIFQVWHGGLAIHGVIFAGLLTLIIYCRRKKQNFWLWADLLAPAFALGQAIGRWGNYFNQEVFGKPTSLPWGIPIDVINRPAGFESFEFFHPTFLYESILNLAVFGILIFLHIKRLKKNRHPERSEGSHYLHYGAIFLTYLILYSVIRIAMEQLRLDATPIIVGIRLPVLVSLIIIIISSWLLIKKQTILEKS